VSCVLSVGRRLLASRDRPLTPTTSTLPVNAICMLCRRLRSAKKLHLCSGGVFELPERPLLRLSVRVETSIALRVPGHHRRARWWRGMRDLGLSEGDVPRTHRHGTAAHARLPLVCFLVCKKAGYMRGKMAETYFASENQWPENRYLKN